MYIGTIFPWREFQMPDVTGITVGRLFILGFLILLFRRIPAIFLTYKLMPRCVKNWKEALFMGYFGPIGEYSIVSVSWFMLISRRYRRSLLRRTHSPPFPQGW
jgi:NhaP-type Na+/H+ or K+/H+ antiporter